MRVFSGRMIDWADRPHGGGDEVVQLAHDRLASVEVVLEVVERRDRCASDCGSRIARSHFGHCQSGRQRPSEPPDEESQILR